ncbi:MAG TPA: GNAT family N-acetyltransferase [Actinophytocola sp.]|uniref:GNAT family N-acetyltransferase n=1 Tax=Actinophytocola sp. TaxID=1872138 RepID=UPI002DBB52F1|nr:GNAT family N-acetyltransferase [Actinophytocola sp.]HEU5472235.1 GNAT family N-acetyltransferase [Actinophytocola sp.]
MEALWEVARKHACSRVEWTADRDSDGARRFYAKLGTAVHGGKLFYRAEFPDA